jgi:hypothetical protein
VQELWARNLKTQLALKEADLKVLRANWNEKFKANELVLLDGFDETARRRTRTGD